MDMASEVDDAEGLALGATAGAEACDCEELVLFAAEEEVPLVVGAAWVEGGVRLALEALCVEGTEVLLLDLRVEPTSLRNREFMFDDMET